MTTTAKSCCLACGRDTRAKGGICARCTGEYQPRPRRRRDDEPDLDPLEDDYGDESDADSVCDDSPA
jgi:predicted amidophosphoribosyltransferase